MLEYRRGRGRRRAHGGGSRLAPHTEHIDHRLSEGLENCVALVPGVNERLGTREMGRNLRSAIDDIPSRKAEGIARTEVNGAANRGNFLALEEAQVEYVQWIAALDARTRPSHVAHHGLVVRRGERFPNGLLHPGDRNGTIGEWFACRCAATAYFPLRSELGQQTPFVGRA